jgi:hypothetical protein
MQINPDIPCDERESAAILKAYNLALSPGMQHNPARRRHVRQIAGDVVQCLAELMVGIQALQKFCDELPTAYLLNKPLPRELLLEGEWPELEDAAQYAFDVRDALLVGDAAAAWRAAAGAGVAYRDAEHRLRLELQGQRAKVAAEVRIADGRDKGAKKNRAKRDARRHRAIEIYRAGAWDSRTDAIADIAVQMNMAFTTVERYLRKVTTS